MYLSKLRFINALSVCAGIYFVLINTLNISYLLSDLFFLVLLLFFLPGIYFLKLVATSCINGIEAIDKPDIRTLLALAIILGISLWTFLYPTLLAPVPSPYPYHAGWDEFVYQMISWKAASGKVQGFITDINPTTQELPIPLGFPAAVGLILKTLNISPFDAVWLLKIGVIIPVFIGSLWIGTIAERKVGLRWALVACFISFSFSAFNVPDVKFFLPSAFAWALGFGVYCIIFSTNFNVRQKLAFCFLLLAAAFSYHFYTTALVFATILLAGILYLISNFLQRYKPSLLRVFLLYPLALFVVCAWIHVNGFQIVLPGGGPVNADFIQSTMRMLRSISPFVWLVPIVEILAKPFHKKYERLSPMSHIYILTLFVFYLPLSASFRVLYWASGFACILTITFIYNSVHLFAERNSKFSTNILVIFLGTMIVIASVYPIYVPFSTEPVYYVDTPTGKVVTNYSFSEYRSARYITENLGKLNLLIISDRGYAVILGGLTGKESFRVRGNISEELQSILKNLHRNIFDKSIANQLVELTDRYYDLVSYDSLLLAFSSRTYAFIEASSDVTFYAPLSPEYVDPIVRVNLVASNLLDHIYHENDVDLFVYTLNK